jgi:hypothetical protein
MFKQLELCRLNQTIETNRMEVKFSPTDHPDLEINISAGDHHRSYKVWLEVYTPDFKKRKWVCCSGWSFPDPGQNLGMNKLSARVSFNAEICEYSVRKIDRRQLLQKETHATTRNGRKLEKAAGEVPHLQISYLEKITGT